MNNEIVILLQIDACRNDYISETKTPFISKLISDGNSGILKPTFGFEPDAAYIAGLFPDEADGGAQFWYDPVGSPFGSLSYLPKWLNKLPRVPNKIARKIIQLNSRKHSQSPTFSTACIPFHLLKYFSFPMQYSMDHKSFVKSNTVFDYLRENNELYFFHCFPNHKVDINSVVSHVESELFPPATFAFLHIGDLDRVGHQFGPDSNEISEMLTKVDNGLKEIYEIASLRFENVHLLLIGDHGMVEVKNHLNIWEQLIQLPLKLEKDYLFFIDSTMVRFWFFSSKSKDIICNLLQTIPNGHILTESEKTKYHLNYSHNKFGNIIFLADPGVLLFPNFYQNQDPVKGMHGYAPESKDQQSIFIINSTRINKDKEPEEPKLPIDMRRIFPTTLDLLGLPFHDSAVNESLIK